MKSDVLAMGCDVSWLPLYGVNYEKLGTNLNTNWYQKAGITDLLQAIAKDTQSSLHYWTILIWD